MEVYLVRHTTPKIGKGICYGQTNLEIEESLFGQELKRIQDMLPKDLDEVYSSPLQRCVVLAQHLSASYKTDQRLMEMNFGDWENKYWHDIEQQTLNHWMEDFVHVAVPNGESYMCLYQRTLSFIAQLQSSNKQKVAIVTHAGNIRSLISFALSLALEHSFRIHLDYGAVVLIELDKKENYHKLRAIMSNSSLLKD